MSAGHTPGPWAIIPAVEYDGADDEEMEGAYTCPASIEGADGSPVCMFGDSFGSGTLYENEADYRLIAAAPEGYELIEQLEESFTADGTYQQFLPAMRAYLAKATGDAQ